MIYAVLCGQTIKCNGKNEGVDRVKLNILIQLKFFALPNKRNVSCGA